MNKFDELLNNFSADQFLTESIVNLPRDSLDSNVFQFFDDGRQPILKDGIKAQILENIEAIHSVVPVVRFLGIGSLFTQHFTDESDLDVNVQVDVHDLDSISAADILQELRRLNGKMAVGTTHPINYYCVTDEFDYDKAEAVYDIMNERWLKTPEVIDPDISGLYSRFQETVSSLDISSGELRRNLIDLAEIEKLKTSNVQSLHDLLQKKLNAIEENVKQLVSVYHDVTVLRKMAFDQMLTPQEIQIYGSKNALPENIIYKLLEKYYYIRFLSKLKKILDERDEGGLFDTDKLGKIGRAFWKIK